MGWEVSFPRRGVPAGFESVMSHDKLPGLLPKKLNTESVLFDFKSSCS